MSDAMGSGRQARDTAKQLMDRINTDRAFVDQIRADPVGALTDAGLPAEMVGDFLHTADIPVEGDVSGYMMCSDTCLDETSVRCRINTAKYPY